jgi:hypothetical protein
MKTSSTKRSRGFLVLLSVVLLVCLPQVLQNSHKYPYGIAFQGYKISGYLDQFEKAQQFVLDQTKKKDRLMVWVEPNTELVQYAAAQLWGPNSVNHTLIFSDWDRANLKVSQPTHVVLYTRSDQILGEYISNLNFAGWETSNQKCQKISATEIGSGFSVCVFGVRELK